MTPRGAITLATFTLGAIAGSALCAGILYDFGPQHKPLVLRTTLPPDALARSLHDWVADCETQRAACLRGQAALTDHGAGCDFAADRCAASWKETP